MINLILILVSFEQSITILVNIIIFFLLDIFGSTEND